MSKSWEIGKEAMELDEKPISERMKIKKRSIMRIGLTLVLYALIMTMFYFVL
jgi:hypothetical protein